MIKKNEPVAYARGQSDYSGLVNVRLKNNQDRSEEEDPKG
jgi:hypothetical protein